MARLYQKINNEAVPLGGGGGGSVAIDNDTITKNSDGELQVATALTGKINQLNNVAADMGKVLTANGDGTAEWDDVLVPIDYETITKNSNGELQVSSVPYDNTTSGLEADNVQDAIDELNSDLSPTEELITPNNYIVIASSLCRHFEKLKLALIGGVWRVNQAIPAGQGGIIVGSVADAIKPSGQVGLFMPNDGYINNVSWIEENGDIKIMPSAQIPAGTYIQFNASYPTN